MGGEYGNSQCIKPQDPSEMTTVPDCYKNEENRDNPAHALQFVQHEWDKHGSCAGAKDGADFFNQVCSLSADPLKLVEAQKEKGASLKDMANAVQQAGYPVYELDTTEEQILVSVCACTDGRWKIADPSKFASMCCGGSGPAPGPAPPPAPPSPAPPPAPPSPAPPAPAPAGGSCTKSVRGPACSSDGDCSKLPGCVRCAHSGYCTDIPTAQSNVTLLV